MSTVQILDEKKTGLERWNIDPSHSGISFIARHMLISNVRGEFGKFSGSITLPAEDLGQAKAEAVIDINSIDTNDATRNGHLMSADFFDAANHPEIRFESTGIRVKDDENFEMTGNLTMHGITKPVSLQGEYTGKVIDPWGNERMGFLLKGSVNRFDYDLKWNALLEAGGAVVGPAIKLEANVEVVKQKEA